MPGSCNALITELFYEQSKRWEEIAERHVQRLHIESCQFAKNALEYVAREDQVRQEVWKIVKVPIQDNHTAAKAELGKLLDDEKMQPITYNHYYTDNIQKDRHDSTKRTMGQALENFSMKSFSSEDVLEHIQEHVTVDMDQQACDEAKASLSAYYKVSPGSPSFSAMVR